MNTCIKYIEDIDNNVDLPDELYLYLENFRCWNKLELILPTNKIILLKGESGSGKSTIFQAIYWLLFDNIKKITPINNKNARTKVIIKYGNITIERCRSPKILKLQIDDKLYDGNVAQGIIYEKFGNTDIWNASCYIMQSCRNYFLTTTNLGKMDLLNKIAFTDTKLTDFMSQIDEKINNKSKFFDIYTSKYDTLLKIYNTKWNQNIDFSNILSENEIFNINISIDNLQKNKKILEDNLINRNIKLKELNLLNNKLNNYQNSIPNKINPPEILNYDINILYNYDESYKIINEMISYKNKLNLLYELKNEYEKLPENFYIKFNIDELNKILEEKKEELNKSIYYETLRNENIRICKEINIEYNLNVIENKIDEYIDLVDSQKELNRLNNIELINKELNNINIIDPINPNPNNESLIFKDIIKPDTNKLQIKIKENENKIQELKTLDNIAKNTIKCPYCDNSVKYVNGKILKVDIPDTNDIYIKIEEFLEENRKLKLQEDQINNEYNIKIKEEQERINKLNKLVTDYKIEIQKNENNKNKKNELMTKLYELEKISFNNNYKNTKILSQKEIDKYNILIDKLENIKIIDGFTLSKDINIDISNIETAKKKNEIKNKIELIYIDNYNDIDIIKIENKINIFQNWIEAYRKYKFDLELSLNNIKDIENQISMINIPEDCTETINKINKEILEYNEIIQNNNIKIESQKEWNEILKVRNEMDNIFSELSILKKIKKLAIESECEVLQYTIDCINSSISDVCSTMFNSDIGIELCTSKELKSKKETIQSINFSISYREGIFDNVSQLSGGEGDRISLALTMGLNKISTCPFLLLDESLASLDNHMKEVAVDTIKQHCIFKTILCIAHDEFDDIYDHIIDISKIPKKPINQNKVSIRKKMNSIKN